MTCELSPKWFNESRHARLGGKTEPAEEGIEDIEDIGVPEVRTSLTFRRSREAEAGTRRGGGRSRWDPECSGAAGGRAGHRERGGPQ